jgi:hypothetical protein
MNEDTTPNPTPNQDGTNTTVPTDITPSEQAPTTITPTTITDSSPSMSTNPVTAQQPSSGMPVATQTVDQSQSVTPMPAGANPAGVVPNAKKRPTWLIPVIAASVLLIGGSAAAYTALVAQSPERLWAKSLETTQKGFQTFVDSAATNTKKGGSIDGSFQVEQPLVIDGTIKGQWYETTGSFESSLGAAGARVTTDLILSPQTNGETPDIYLKVDGLDGLDALISSFAGPSAFGVADQISSLNGQWYVIDRTFLEESLMSGTTTDASDLSEQDIEAILAQTATVFSDYIFTTDPAKAVLGIAQEYGKEEFEGADTYKMQVQVNKENLKAFLTAYKDALATTKVKELYTQAMPDMSFEEALEFDELLKSIDETNFDNAKADVWIDMKRKFVRNVRITDSPASKILLDIGLPYDGGDELPFTIRLTNNDEATGNTGTVKFVYGYNQKNGDGSLSFDIDIKADGSPVKANGRLSVKGSDEQVSVDVPQDAKNIFELLGALSGDLYDDSLLNSQSYMLDDSVLFPLDDVELQ